MVIRGEFKKHIETLGLNEDTTQNLLKLVEDAGAEFPCLQCNSNDGCENFKWYIKWFSNKIDNNPF